MDDPDHQPEDAEAPGDGLHQEGSEKEPSIVIRGLVSPMARIDTSIKACKIEPQEIDFTRFAVLGLRPETVEALQLFQLDEFQIPTEVPWVERLVSELAIEMSQTRFHSCFLSHATADWDFAEQLCADLNHIGVRVWFAPRDMEIGARIRSSIEKSIEEHDRFLLVLSENSINSAWVESEVESCFERERKLSVPLLFPIRIDDAVMSCQSAWASEIRRTRHIGDFRSWKASPEQYKGALEKLVKVLLKRPAETDSSEMA